MLEVKHTAAQGNAGQDNTAHYPAEWEKNIIRLKNGGEIYNDIKHAHDKVTGLEASLSELKRMALHGDTSPTHAHAISILQEELAKAKNQLATLTKRKWLSEEDYLRTVQEPK